MKINVPTTGHLSTRKNSLPTNSNGEELTNVNQLKYLGSVIDNDGTIDRDVEPRVRAALSSRMELTGVFCVKKIPLGIKSKHTRSP